MQTLNRYFYSIYKSAYPSGQRRKNRITPAGQVVIGAAVLSAALGLDTTRSATYQLFTLLSATLAVAFLFSRVFRARFSVTRTLPPFATAGEKMTYSVTIRNLTLKKQSNLLIQEVPTFGYPTYEEFLSAREPGEAKRNRWDQAVKYYRFEWLMEQHTRIVPREHPLPEIGANSYLNTYLELEPKRRGFLELAGISIKRIGPLGLFKAALTLPQPDRLLILPKRFPLPPVQLPGSRKHHAGGVALASSVGNADEFRTLREYRPGDPMRRLHWKSVAKTGNLIIRENEDEYFVRHALILDTFIDRPYSQAFETAVSIAASFACTIDTQESMLDLIFVGDRAHCFSFGRGVDHTSKMLEILACVSPCSDKPFSTLFPLIKEHAARLSGCICILQAWDDNRKELVRLLTERSIPVKILVMTDTEIETPVDPVHFIHTGHPEKDLARL
ncbi:MAG: DUF58 domain-containing protein [Pontiellaceae bacterium]|nr:DUF58 domain-containing protein [Pontiellaceae bacterium]